MVGRLGGRSPKGISTSFLFPPILMPLWLLSWHFHLSKQGPTLMVLVLCKTRSVVLCVHTNDLAVPRGGAGASDSRVRAPQ